MKLIKVYLYSLIIILIIGSLAFLIVKFDLLKKSEPEYFLNVNLSPEKMAELMKRREDNFKRLEIFPNTFEVYLDLGNIERELGNASKAIDYLKEAAKINPVDPTPWLNIGQIYVSLGLYPQAESVYLKAKQLNSHYPLPYLFLAELYQNYYKEKSNQIRSIYLEGLNMNDNTEQIMIPFATYLTESGNYSEALLYWQELMKRLPERTDFQEMIDKCQKNISK